MRAIPTTGGMARNDNLFLCGCENGRPRLIFHGFRQGSYRAKHHAPGLAMLDASRFPTTFYSINAEVAEPGCKRHKVHIHFIRALSNNLFDPDAAIRTIIIMLLLAGDLTGMTPGAPFILYQQTITSHGYSLSPDILVTRQRPER
jgi:hypothetical protein